MTTATMLAQPQTAVSTRRGRPDYLALAAAEPNRCTGCSLLIFTDPAEAAVCQIPYVITVNHAIGELCIGCAGGDESMDRLLTLVERIEDGEPIERKEIRMSENNGLFLKMEVGVMPPLGSTAGGGESKYVLLEKEIMKLPIGKGGESEWARFKMVDSKAVTNAGTWLAKRKRSAYEPQGHSLRRRTVKNEDGTAWLYVQRYTIEEK